MDKKALLTLLSKTAPANLREYIKASYRGEPIRVAFTGACMYTRMQIITWLKDHFTNVDAQPSLVKDTDLIIVGDNPGSKLARAQKMGVAIWQAEELYRLMETVDVVENSKP